ncbi:alpha/beta hydrolase [Rhodanobacter sp. FDAARGOS 1247]|uniref:alpha/beta hydrolase n=1 Tax=Rhodanobacter sp. FDAARGOS 1247 TaxID=2778082 RepID=UPI001EF6D567|nr:alpha/beta hydrolase-fold protein [Rhodanobacter sp. FDAARGOS 1247]
MKRRPTRGVLLLLLGLVVAGHAAAEDVAMPAHASFNIDSAVLHEARHINVYTPPAYPTAKDARYPVLYMPDGGLQEDFPHVAADVDAAIRAGAMRPMIVVGIENTERRRDMTGPTTLASDREIAPRVGGSAAFRAFMADELMPEVQRRYRTDGHRAIVGESLAGLFVVETFFAQPKLFDTWIALSPSLWWNDIALARGAAARLQAQPSLASTLYVASAGDDGLDESGGGLLREALRKHAPRGLRWYYQPWPELKHATIYRGASPAIFRQLFAPK